MPELRRALLHLGLHDLDLLGRTEQATLRPVLKAQALGDAEQRRRRRYLQQRWHALIEDTGANACGLTNGTNGNIIGVDPNLAALANNGGPTQTMAVLSGSAAVNAGDEAVCAAAPVNGLDQRGYVRPGGGYPNCTIGAFEFWALPPRYTGPALSPVGLLGLGALLGAAGWRKARGASGAR